MVLTTPHTGARRTVFAARDVSPSSPPTRSAIWEVGVLRPPFRQRRPNGRARCTPTWCGTPAAADLRHGARAHTISLAEERPRAGGDAPAVLDLRRVDNSARAADGRLIAAGLVDERVLPMPVSRWVGCCSPRRWCYWGLARPRALSPVGRSSQPQHVHAVELGVGVAFLYNLAHCWCRVSPRVISRRGVVGTFRGGCRDRHAGAARAGDGARGSQPEQLGAAEPLATRSHDRTAHCPRR